MKKPTAKPKKLTKAERKAQQAEFNRQLWQEAYEKKDSRSLSYADRYT